MSYLSFAIALFSLLLSWMNFRRGKLQMTKPAFVAFCYDVGKDNQPLPKIFIRALLYSTGRRGHVMENMYIIVRSGKRKQTFNVWGHGDEKLSRGSGLFIGETGVVTNHHFNPPSKSNAWDYLSGDYEIDIFATLPGHHLPLRLHTITVTIDAAIQLPTHPDAAIWFDWQPDENRYDAHVETRRIPHSLAG
jgi:hypothetical protein